MSKKLSLLVLPIIATFTLQANDPFFDDPFGDDIFVEMMQMQKSMDKMFDRMQNRMHQRSSRLMSPLGTYKLNSHNQFEDKGDRYEYVSNIPENSENEIKISIENYILSINAKIINKHEEKSKNGYRNFSSISMYQNSISMPKDADMDSVKAEYKNGKLVISTKKKTILANKRDVKITKSKESNKTSN